MTAVPGDDQSDLYDVGDAGEVSVDEDDQLTAEDQLLDDDVADPLDRGYSPPEKPSAGQGFGNTAYEEATGESLDQRLAQERPEPDPYEQAENEDVEDIDDGEVGEQRAGRITVAADDDSSTMMADDVGIDGAAASAEEAALNVVPEGDEI